MGKVEKGVVEEDMIAYVCRKYVYLFVMGLDLGIEK